MNYDLLRAIRDLPDGCMATGCDRPVMMLVRPTPPRTAYRLVCERHTRSDYCINDAIAHSHVADWTECQLEEYNPARTPRRTRGHAMKVRSHAEDET